MHYSRPVRGKKNSPQRNRLAKRLRTIRQRDKHAYAEPVYMRAHDMHYPTRRTAQHYEQLFRTNFVEHLLKILTTKRDVYVLDVGAGEGHFGNSILQRINADIRPRVHVHGIGLVRPDPSLVSEFASYRIGNVEQKARTIYHTRQFDLITCYGPVVSPQLIIQLAHKLSRRGKAFITTSIDTQGEYDTLAMRLQKKGFETTLINVSVVDHKEHKDRHVTFSIARKAYSKKTELIE